MPLLLMPRAGGDKREEKKKLPEEATKVWPIVSETPLKADVMTSNVQFVIFSVTLSKNLSADAFPDNHTPTHQIMSLDC